MIKICDWCGKGFEARGSGKRCSDECKVKAKARRMSKYNKGRRADPEYMARLKEYRQKPEYKQQQAEYKKTYNKRPERKEYHREYMTEYRHRPVYRDNHIEHQREYNQRPEVKERYRQLRASKKAILLVSSLRGQLNVEGV